MIFLFGRVLFIKFLCCFRFFVYIQANHISLYEIFCTLHFIERTPSVIFGRSIVCWKQGKLLKRSILQSLTEKFFHTGCHEKRHNLKWEWYINKGNRTYQKITQQCLEKFSWESFLRKSKCNIIKRNVFFF